MEDANQGDCSSILINDCYKVTRYLIDDHDQLLDTLSIMDWRLRVHS